ncbi:MAG: T9SS type A sorting domain-containing protein, partial [candidate division WOR-3 bacterium]|nr:T9SS type A sorting domain-containing protein [candidate division WOR-3 bacterium]
FELGGLVDGTNPSTKRILLDSIMHFFGIFPTSIEEENADNITPTKGFLVYPNPFNHKLFIACAQTDINIYDISGNLIKTLTSNSQTSNCLIWDGTNNYGLKMPAGVYFISSKLGKRTITKRVVLLAR